MKKREKSVISKLYNYKDYRVFLNDLINEKRAKIYGFSLSSFSKKIGFSSHSFLKFVINGERNLSGKSIQKLAKTVFATSEEIEYFTLLVYYNQASSLEEKEKFYQQLQSHKQVVSSLSLKGKYSKFYESWYYPVIKELMVSTKWNSDVNRLVEMLQPKITYEQAKEAVEYLLEVGLVKKNNKGDYYTTNEHLNSNETPFYIKKQSRREVLELGIESVDRFDKNERYTAYTTLMLDKKSYKEIEKLLNDCRKKIIKIAANSRSGDVYEAILQLFPVTKVNDKDLK